MVQLLQPHPATSGGAVEAIEAEVERDGARLTLRYVLTGDVGALVLPATSSDSKASRCTSDGSPAREPVTLVTSSEVRPRPTRHESAAAVMMDVVSGDILAAANQSLFDQASALLSDGRGAAGPTPT